MLPGARAAGAAAPRTLLQLLQRTVHPAARRARLDAPLQRNQQLRQSSNSRGQRLQDGPRALQPVPAPCLQTVEVPLEPQPCLEPAEAPLETQRCLETVEVPLALQRRVEPLRRGEMVRRVGQRLCDRSGSGVSAAALRGPLQYPGVLL